MKKESWKLFVILLVIITAVLLLWDITIAAGYLAGGLLSALLYFRNASYCANIEYLTPGGSVAKVEQSTE